MRLLYIANMRIPTPRAYGIQIMKTCEALQKEGHDVELIIPSRKATSSDDPFLLYGITTPFRLTTLPIPDLLFLGPIGFIISAVLFSERVRLLERFKSADVLYSRDAWVLFQYALLNRSWVFESHSKPTLLSVWVAKRAQCLVVISKGLKKAYVKAGVPEHTICVAPDAVDEHLFDSVPQRDGAREALGIPLTQKVVVYAGHLYTRKGVDTLARASALLPDVHVYFVGGTTEDVADFRLRYAHISTVHVIGYVPHHEVPMYLRSADVLVLPNTGNDEDASTFTSPMKLFEYMLSGVPIVASDVPALREILSEEAAMLVDPDEPKALCRGIEVSLRDGEQAQKRAVKAYAIVKNYTWGARARMIASSIQIYDKN